MSPKTSLSLKTKILLLFAGTTLLVSLSTAIVFQMVAFQLKENAENGLLPYANSLADSIAAQFFERYADVQAFAINQGLQNQNEDEIQKILDQYIRMYQIYDTILLVDLDGKLIASNSVAPDGTPINNSSLKELDFKNSNWFVQVNRKTSQTTRKKGLKAPL